MTEKLYYTNSHQYEFEAVVNDILTDNNRFLVVLDRTAFFPEGGGQKADEGFLDATEIYDVFEKDGIIYHATFNKPEFNLGDTIKGHINKSLRFSRMQAHSGEHVFSGIAHNLYGVENVGFHMDGLVMTIDFDIPLSKDQIDEIELKANLCVYENLKITAQEYAVDDIKDVEYRSKLEFSDYVRIVEIDGIDKCACCAPHVDYTGEIGLIKVLSNISHRGGVRIELICGIMAFNDYVSKYQQTINIAAKLCAKHNETDTAVNKLYETNSELRYKLNGLEKRQLLYICDALTCKDRILYMAEDVSISLLRDLTLKINEKADDFTLVLIKSSDSVYSYCIASDKLDLSKLVKDFNKSLNGTGGGRGNIVQGKVTATIEDIKDYFNGIKVKDYENA